MAKEKTAALGGGQRIRQPKSKGEKQVTDGMKSLMETGGIEPKAFAEYEAKNK